MRDLDRTEIPNRYPEDTRHWDDGVQVLRGSRVDEHCLIGLGRNKYLGSLKTIDMETWLRQLRKKLNSGSVYTLALVDQPFMMQACFMESDKRQLNYRRNKHWINAQCDDTPVPFKVLAAAPIPQFSISIAPNSNICHSSRKCDFFLSVTVTSLSRTPVKMSSDDLGLLWSKVGSKFGEIECRDLDAQWRVFFPYFRDFKDEMGLGNGASGIGSVDREWYNSTYRSWHNYSDNRVVCFPYGGTETRQMRLSSIDFNCLPVTHSCRMGLQLEFTCLTLGDWNYAATTDGVDADDLTKWPSKGYIIPEPVNPDWNEVESILEAAKPLPLFKLPRELRDIIYDLAKWSNKIRELQFTYIVD
ncbi:MAG: hypothetical protein Q9221_004708 [Calogaya cf. arnoldii]